MRIVCIFEGKFDEELYAFHYDGEVDNEFDRLMELWTDITYLRNFAIKNKVEDVKAFVEARLRNAEDFQDRLDEIIVKTKPLNQFFVPYHNQEYGSHILLSQRKGKLDRNSLRIYALKVHENCFVITGGAIKMTQTTQDNDDNAREIVKMKKARDFLIREGVFDDASFYELLNELE